MKCPFVLLPLFPFGAELARAHTELALVRAELHAEQHARLDCERNMHRLIVGRVGLGTAAKWGFRPQHLEASTQSLIAADDDGKDAGVFQGMFSGRVHKVTMPTNTHMPRVMWIGRQWSKLEASEVGSSFCSHSLPSDAPSFVPFSLSSASCASTRLPAQAPAEFFFINVVLSSSCVALRGEGPSRAASRSLVATDDNGDDAGVCWGMCTNSRRTHHWFHMLLSCRMEEQIRGPCCLWVPISFFNMCQACLWCWFFFFHNVQGVSCGCECFFSNVLGLSCMPMFFFQHVINIIDKKHVDKKVSIETLKIPHCQYT